VAAGEDGLQDQREPGWLGWLPPQDAHVPYLDPGAVL
jgi:hypothetical protein